MSKQLSDGLLINTQSAPDATTPLGVNPTNSQSSSTEKVDTAKPTSLLRRYAGSISLTYMLTLAENGVRLAYPLVIGMTIDALLKGRSHMIMAVIAIWILHLAVGITRGVYDTHAFTRVYSDLVERTVTVQRQENVEPEVIAGRVALSREIVEFFQFGVPALVTSIVGLIGSAFMLARHDALIGAMVIAVLFPVMGMYIWFGKRSLRLHRLLNNQMEREIGLILRRPIESVARHMGRLRAWRLRISLGEAKTWGAVDLCSLALCAVLLTRLASQPGVTPGNIYAAMAYLFDFNMAVGLLPQVLQHGARVRDIWRRLAT